LANKIVIVASGGGHTGYAVALAQRLMNRAKMIFIVPEGDLWTKSKVEMYGSIVYVRKARGPRDNLIKAVPGLIKAGIESFHMVSKNYDALVSSGSNHSVPPAIVGKLKGLKLINIESSVRFTRPSMSARFLEPLSDLTALQWPEQKRILPSGKLVGPIYEKPLYKPHDEGYILVTGGTYGHKILFDIIDKLDLDRIVLQTGRINPEPYKKKHKDWIVFDFDPDFGKWIAGASVVVSHLGKTVLDAALTYQKPVIIALNPEWRYTAGREDAAILAKKLNAVLVEEITRKNILNALKEAEKHVPPKYPDGAQKLANEILKI